MNELKDYKEIIHKCSKCGLCQSVCPTYLETGNECVVSRGQFIMLQGIIKGDLKMNKNINKYLDLCLKCGKCSGFCPSDIDIVEIILSAKSEYFKHSVEGKLLSILQSKQIFNTALSIARFIFGRQKKFKKQFNKKAIYFGGCIETIYPKTSEYIKQLLNEMEIEVIDKKFNCCGLPFLTSGNINRFVEQVKENIEKIKDVEFDYFITDCASCRWTWQEYVKYINDEDLKHKLENIQFKSIYELILEHKLKFKTKQQCSITYHQACHEDKDIEKIISDIENTNYIELEGKSECCGFSALLKPSTWNITKNIFDKKKQNILKTNVDYVLTTCVGCVLSLSSILAFKQKVVRVIDFLRTNCVSLRKK